MAKLHVKHFSRNKESVIITSMDYCKPTTILRIKIYVNLDCDHEIIH
jgi:hypothetical protein